MIPVIIIIIIIALFAIWILNITTFWIWFIVAWFIFISLSIRLVSPNTVKAVKLFQRFNRIIRPWLNFLIPLVESTDHQDLFRKNFPVEVEWVTKDNVTAYIGLNVIYYVDDEWDDSRGGSIYKSIYSIQDPKTMMRSTIDEQLRAMIFNFTHKEIFWKREEIWESIEKRLREKLAQFWFTLDSIQVRDVKLEGTVMAAMNKEIQTEKLKVAALNEAEAKKIMQVKEAEAEKEAKILLWEWMAGQRMKIAEWFKESVDLIKQTDDSLNAEKVLQFLLDSSRIETLWSIGSHENAKLIYLNEDLEWKVSRARNEKLISWSEIM